MIFALIDYIKYKKSKGLYNLRNDPIMRYGFPCEIPDLALNALEPGDIIFTFTSDCLISWIIMYLTKARMSHTAIYIGNNSIIHSTTEGVISQPIESLFSKKSVLLPLHLQGVIKKDRKKMIKFVKNKLGYPFGWKSIFIKFLRIVTGRDLPYYRLAYFIDLLLILLLLDLPLFLLFKKIIFILLVFPYLLLLIINRFLWRRVPIPFDKNYVKPIEIYKMLILKGATIYANPNGFPYNGVLKKILYEKLKTNSH